MRLLASCFQAPGRKRYQQFHIFWLHHVQNFTVHKNSDSSFFFFCQTELITPIRNCSVDTELIDRVNCLEQEFCIYRICFWSEWYLYLSFASRLHDSKKHWCFWRQDDQSLWITVPCCRLYGPSVHHMSCRTISSPNLDPEKSNVLVETSLSNSWLSGHSRCNSHHSFSTRCRWT